MNEEEKITNEVPEIVEEQKEEQLAPEIKEADVKPNNIYYLRKDNETPFIETVENERKELFKFYKKTSLRNNIIMIAAVAVFVAAFILLTQGQWGMITGWCLVGVSVVGMVLYHILTRNAYPRKSKHYFNTFWTLSNEYIFNAPEFTDCHVDFNEKYQLAETAADRVYKDIIDIASRNLIHGFYKEKGFVYGELAFYKQGEKKRSKDVLFVGRHIALSNSLVVPEGRLLVNIRGEKEFDLPTDIEDLVELVHEDNFIIYGPEGVNAEKVLGKETIRRLKNVKVNSGLLNVNIVFWSGRTAAYLSYDDSIAAIPFQTEIKGEAYTALRSTVEEMFSILGEL